MPSKRMHHIRIRFELQLRVAGAQAATKLLRMA